MYILIEHNRDIRPFVLLLHKFSLFPLRDGVGVVVMKNRLSWQLLLLLLYSLKRQSPVRSFKCIANTSSKLLGKLRPVRVLAKYLHGQNTQRGRVVFNNV